MDMRQLKYFVQIVESGSLSKASRQLFIAQPSLSQQMARLEEEIGQPLLLRSVRGVSPTPNGEALYHHAKFILRQLQEAVVVARQDASRWTGRVTLGLPPTTVHVLGFPLLRHLKRKYPGITLNVVEALSGQLEDMARNGQVDLALMIRQSSASDLGFEPLLEEGLYVILPASSKLIAARKKSITLAEVSKLPLLLPSSPMHSLRRSVMVEFERAKLPVHLVGEVDSLLLLLRLVAEGEGVTIRTMSVTKLLYTLDQWRCVPIADVKMMLTHFIYALPQDKLSPGAALVRAEMKDVVRQLVLSGEWPGTRLCA